MYMYMYMYMYIYIYTSVLLSTYVDMKFGWAKQCRCNAVQFEMAACLFSLSWIGQEWHEWHASISAGQASQPRQLGKAGQARQCSQARQGSRSAGRA